MFHFQISRLLSAYADGELDQQSTEEIHHHVQQCNSCASKVEKINISKKAVSFTTISPAPERIWNNIEKELFEMPDSRKLIQSSKFSVKYLLQSPNLKLASALAGFVLLAISIAWWEIGFNDSIDSPEMVQSSSVLGFDYGRYLDAVVSKNSTAAFSEIYDGIPINIEIAHTIANEGNFHICINPNDIPSYELKEILVLTDGSDYSLQLDYANEGDLVTIFQQPIANPLSLGERETKEVEISGIACLKVVDGNMAVLTWESGNTRFVAIGNSVTIDFEEIVSASIKHSNS